MCAVTGVAHAFPTLQVQGVSACNPCVCSRGMGVCYDADCQQSCTYARQHGSVCTGGAEVQEMVRCCGGARVLGGVQGMGRVEVILHRALHRQVTTSGSYEGTCTATPAHTGAVTIAQYHTILLYGILYEGIYQFIYALPPSRPPANWNTVRSVLQYCGIL